MRSYRKLSCVLAVIASLLVIAPLDAATNRQSRTKEPKEFISKAQDNNREFTLRFVKATRDPVVATMATLTFEVTPGRGTPFSAYDPGLELLGGLSELWQVKSTFTPAWRKKRYGERKWIVRLKVFRLKPGVDDLRFLRVRLHYKGYPRGGDFRQVEFEFDRIPLEQNGS